MERLLGKHSSQPFNPDVANAFFRAGMIEAWGRGIERIIDTCKMERVPVPELRYEATGLWLVFPYSLDTRPASGGTPVKTPVKIIELLQANPSMTLAEVAAEIGKSLSAVERASAKLIENGRLKRVGAAKGGHWEVSGGNAE